MTLSRESDVSPLLVVTVVHAMRTAVETARTQLWPPRSALT